MRRLLAASHWVLAVLVGIAVGAVSVWWATGTSRFSVVPGHPEWRHGRNAGSVHAGPYARAAVARYGLLALKLPEAIYFGALDDAAGRPFNAACTYTMTGKPLPARWWSLTLYAQDGFLPRNGDHANHIGNTNVVLAPDGTFSIRIAPGRDGAANWLSTRHAGRFVISLRMYHPSQDVIAGAMPDLPAIHRVSCAGGQP